MGRGGLLSLVQLTIGCPALPQALLLVTGSIQAALPIISAVFVGVIACWIRAVSVLHSTIKVQLRPTACLNDDVLVMLKIIHQGVNEADAPALHCSP